MWTRPCFTFRNTAFSDSRFSAPAPRHVANIRLAVSATFRQRRAKQGAGGVHAKGLVGGGCECSERGERGAPLSRFCCFYMAVCFYASDSMFRSLR